ncbi:unnamed protein product, partial [Mesorhabditis belari]|uniref:Chromo domain-containing protein n=1 Tax=Mesorhabditis belari TaxID=2138241 RepID=A0AAF3FB85_9BILA
MSSVKEESKPVVSKAGKKRVHRRQRAKEQRTADSDRSNDEDESARETAAGKKRRQNPMLQTVDYIADMQKKGGKNIYLVKWSGCSSEASTWVSGRQFKAPEKLKFARLRNVARRVIKKLLNKQKESV